jgi:uncharacterized membrane protein
MPVDVIGNGLIIILSILGIQFSNTTTIYNTLLCVICILGFFYAIFSIILGIYRDYKKYKSLRIYM